SADAARGLPAAAERREPAPVRADGAGAARDARPYGDAFARATTGAGVARFFVDGPAAVASPRPVSPRALAPPRERGEGRSGVFLFRGARRCGFFAGMRSRMALRTLSPSPRSVQTNDRRSDVRTFPAE